MTDKENKISKMPSVRRDTPFKGKAVLIEHTFGKKTHLAGQVAEVECEKIRSFYLLEVLKKPPKNQKEPGWFRLKRESRGRNEAEIGNLPDWDSSDPKEVGQTYRAANYTYRFSVGDNEYIYCDECQWRPLWCQKTSDRKIVCGGKLEIDSDGEIVCQKCGSKHSLTMIEGFPRAKTFLINADAAR